MKIFVILAFTLFCICQVCGNNEDVLLNIFKEKMTQLKSENLNGDNPTSTPPKPSPKYDCNANKLVQNTTVLLQNTLNVFADTFSAVYTAVNPGSGEQTCDFGDSIIGKFRCYLWEVNNWKEDVSTVKNILINYQSEASLLISDISEYFKNSCPKKWKM